FCWVSDAVMTRPADIGKFYTPKKVADCLVVLAKKCGFDQLRMSGGEPTIGKPHLLQLLDRLRGKGYRFILETNGIPIAYDESYAKDLSKYDFVHVRVSLKGCNEEDFSILTGADPHGFKLQLESLEKLIEANVSCHPSIMASFSTKKNLRTLIERLRQISPDLSGEIEIEELILYPHVIKRIQKYGLKYYTAYAPDRVPPEQI
ncbi:MAG: radical SAM protein, partial [Candidatus Bathyarchaeia archaeon]|nr:radical SAM protein [Candidatus Bathyarchaeia archaeon]